MKKDYLLSIITINYNNADGLRRTIQSVVSQACRRDFEYIVIDGASTDGSRDILDQYSDQIDVLISEPDSGIYNAMNKGVKNSSGTYCLFLNSGDWLHDQTVIKDVLRLKVVNGGGNDIITGYTLFVNRQKNTTKLCKRGRPQLLTWQYLTKYYIAHPSSLILRERLLQRPYDETLKIVSDWKFFLETYLYDDATYLPIDRILSCFDEGDNASGNQSLVALERQQVISASIPPRILKESDYISPRLTDTLMEVAGAIPYHNLLARIISYSNRCYKALAACKNKVRRLKHN